MRTRQDEYGIMRGQPDVLLEFSLAMLAPRGECVVLSWSVQRDGAQLVALAKVITSKALHNSQNTVLLLAFP